MGVFAGRILKVDLTGRAWKAEETPGDLMEKWLGGRGLGLKILHGLDLCGADPLSEKAALVVAPGPLTATRAPGAGRLSMTAVSPLTGTVFDSNSGGFFGHRLKGSGFDALVISGRSEKPVVLRISPQGVFFEDAADFRGLGNFALRKALAERFGSEYATLTIGPAGEAGSLLANIAHGKRFFGRGGLGAVFGAKNLKAVIALGSYRPVPADPDAFAFVAGEALKLLAAHPITSKGLKQFGTSVMMNVMNAVEALPVANFRKNSFPGAMNISGEAIRDGILAGTHACPGCPVGCGRVVKVDGERMEGPEFETLWSFGADLEFDDLEEIARLNRLANDLGLDTISAGSTIAAARELYELGAIPEDPLRDGPGGLGKLLKAMALKEGEGAPLSDGSRALAAAKKRPEVSMTVKGLEIPAYDPRGCQGQGLAYATSNRGACHLRSYMIAPEILASPKLVDRFASEGKAGLVIVSQNLNAAVDSLVMCRFMSFALKDDYYARLLRTATGFDMDAQGFMSVGERIYNLERLVNLDRGLGRADDTLPQRLLNEEAGSGPARGRPVALKPMLDEYYRFRGWDPDGRPTARKLAELGLS